MGRRAEQKPRLVSAGEAGAGAGRTGLTLRDLNQRRPASGARLDAFISARGLSTYSVTVKRLEEDGLGIPLNPRPAV